jgi:hypothetical protein
MLPLGMMLANNLQIVMLPKFTNRYLQLQFLTLLAAFAQPFAVKQSQSKVCFKFKYNFPAVVTRQ